MGRNRAGFPNIRHQFATHDFIPGQPLPTLILDPDESKPAWQRIVTNELKIWVRPFTLTIDPVVVTLAPGAVSDPIPMVVDGRGHFEIFDAFFQSDQAAQFTVTLFDADTFGPDTRPILMNREIHIATIAGGNGVTLPLSGSFPAATSGGRPFRWPETYWMDVSKPEGAAIFAIFRNLSTTQTQNIRFCLHGRRWYYAQAPARIARRMEEIFLGRPRSLPFFYTTDQFVQLSANQGPVVHSMRFGDDSWTEWIKSSVISTGLFNCTIQDDVDGRIVTGQPQTPFTPMQSNLLFGSAELPFLNWESTLFEPVFTINPAFTDISGAQNTIWLTLSCRKIFPDPRDVELLRPGTAPGGIGP